MPRIQAPDGTPIDFPDTMKDADIEAAMGKLYPKLGPVQNAISHAGDRLSEIPGAIGNAVMHPINTIAGMYGQQKQLAGEGVDAFKSGDYPLAAARAVETVIPGVGPAIANGFKTIKSGDTSGGIGDMIGSVGPAIALKGASMSPKIQAFTKGAATSIPQAVKTNFKIPRSPLAALTQDGPLPAAIGAYVGHSVGHPIAGAAIGGAIGSIPDIVRGGMRAASGEPWFPQSAEAIPNPIIPSGQRLLNRGGIVMPSPPDSSFVRGYDYQSPHETQVLSGPLTPPEQAIPSTPKGPSSGGGSPNPSVTQQYRPSRTNAQFDKNGVRIGRGSIYPGKGR